jgi:hypothetical protein
MYAVLFTETTVSNHTVGVKSYQNSLKTLSLLRTVRTRVSNTTGQCNFLGQRDRSFFIVPGQRDNLKILPWNGTGRDSKSISGTGRGMGQSLLCCQNPGQDYFFPTISCFGTSFHVLEHKFSVLEHPIHVLERPFHVFWVFWEI